MTEAPSLEPGREAEQLGWLALHVQTLGKSVSGLSPHLHDLSQSAKQASKDIEQATRVVGGHLAEVSGELVLTRTQMAESSAVASRHQKALVRWTVVLSIATVVLSIATIAYAIAAFLPWLGRPFSGTSEPVTGRAWVLWKYQDMAPTTNPMTTEVIDAFDTRSDCLRAINNFEQEYKGKHHRIDRLNQTTLFVASAPLGQNREVIFVTCRPDTVDPRGPKGK
jgi:hypothetical protein